MCRWFCCLSLVILLFLGILVRFVSLGKWPLSIDEYYFGKSTLNILSNGLPEFPCGGYYTRGILQQYLTAPILALSSDPEWALRIVPVVFNILGIPAVYLLGKRLGGSLVACAATILFSLSLWEIEFARFARMYVPFQTLFLWELYFLSVILESRKRWPFIGMYLMAGVSLFVYEGAIFLVLVAIVPFFVQRRRPSFGDLLTLVALFVAAVVAQNIDFRQLGAAMTSEASSGAGSGPSLPVTLPPVFLFSIFHSPVWIGIFLLPAIFFLRTLYPLWVKGREGALSAAAWTLVLGCTLANQFALAAGFFILFYLAGLVSVPSLGKPFHVRAERLLSSVAVNLVFFSSFGYWGEGDSPARIMKAFLKFPDVFNQVLFPWFSAMPITTSLILALLGVGIFMAFSRGTESSEFFRVILAVVVGLVMFVGMLKTPFREARYTFFLYPVFLLAACKVLIEISRIFTRNPTSARWLGVGLMAIFIFLSEDFGIYHLTHIGSPEINFRTIYPPARQLLYYPRQDYASPSRYINDNIQSGDLVISMIPVADFYLNKMDYRFESRASGRFRIISACGGEREIWSNAPLLSTKEELFNLIDRRERTVWVLAYSGLRQYRAEEESLIEGKYNNYLVYTSIDNAINLFKLPANMEWFE
jgi:hypothetical protein